MHQFFIQSHQFIRKNRFIAIGIAVLFLVFTGFFASKITFEEDITQIIPKSENSDVTAKALKQLNFSDKITVIIERKKGTTDEQFSEVAQQFLDSVQQCNTYIKEIQGVINQENIQETFDFVYQNLHLFLEDADYQILENKLSKDSIEQQIQKNYRSLISPAGIVSRDFIIKDPLGVSFIALKKLQQLNIGDDFQLKNGFITTKDGNTILLFITPTLSGTETQKSTLFVTQLNNIKDNLNKINQNKATVDYFGSSFIAVANAKQIKSDIHSTTFISLSVLMLLLILFYRKITIPILIFIPPLFGALSGLMVLYFVKDSISAISLSIGAVLLGVTIDYSLHILTHFKANSDVNNLYKDITKPLIISSATTAIAFLCLLFVNSEALKDLGIFAAVSVMVSAVMALLFVPHLYRPQAINHRSTLLDKVAAFSYDKNKFVVGFVVALVAVSFVYYSSVSYNNNLSDLNYIPTEIKQAEAKLEATTNLTSKSIYTVVYGDNLNEVMSRNNNTFRYLTSKKENKEILGFSSTGGLILSEATQTQRIQKWNSFWENKKENVQKWISESSASIGFKPDTHQAFYNLVSGDFKTLDLAAYSQIKALSINEFISQKAGFYTIVSVVKVAPEQRESFINDFKKREKTIVIDRQQLNETFLGKLKDDFALLINYSLIAIFMVLFFFFRRLELVIIGAIPIVLTGVVIAGIMGLTGIQLNVFSTIVCTLIFGHGVDFTIFITSALQKEHTYGHNEIKTYRASIFLAVLTTALAVGVLIFAKHPALHSVSLVSLIGIFTAVLITIVLFPILYRIGITNRPKKGKFPITLRLLIHSTLSFLYYGLGGIFLSVFGQLLLKLAPVKKETKMKWFRQTMSLFMKSVLYTNPFVCKRVLNENKENFDKPAVIISNHTSFLDTLAVGMLSPKIIFLVNDWVYNSPVFGGAVRLAGFYPVSQGLEGGVEHLRKKVEEGYSLMVFPEGQRSWDNDIKRFHKGAFYLAEQLNLDVLPVYIHGNSETLPKGDHIIYDEQITVKIGQRIAINDTSFGNQYAERTKKISRYFKQEFAQLRLLVEDENYFKRKLIDSFLYKDHDIYQYIVTDFKNHKSVYHAINKWIPKEAKITCLTNDYGQLSVLLALQESRRKIKSYISNPENRAVAAHGYWVQKRHLTYTDTLSESFDLSSILVINQEDLTTIEALPLENITTIILMYRFELQQQLVELGYQIIGEENSLLILKK